MMPWLGTGDESSLGEAFWLAKIVPASLSSFRKQHVWPVSELYQLDVKGTSGLPHTQPVASSFGLEMVEVLLLEF